MIVFYNKKTKKIYGTEDRYGKPRVSIKPKDVSKDDVAWLSLSREYENVYPNIISNITKKRIKNVEKLEFEDDPDKKKKAVSKETDGCKDCENDSRFVAAMRQVAREEIAKEVAKLK